MMLKDGQAAVFRCVEKCHMAHHFKKQQSHADIPGVHKRTQCF